MSKNVIYTLRRGIVKRKQHFKKIFLPTLVVSILAVGVITLSSVFAAQTTQWDAEGSQNGATNGLCNTVTSDTSLPAGQQQWLFILTNPGTGPWTLSATFSPATTPSPITANGVQQGGGSIHFTVNTSIGAQLLSASATNGDVHSVLTVSHCTYHQQLQVSKTANTSWQRNWAWTINKTCDQTQLTLAIDETFNVGCSVTVNASSTDSLWAVAGNITIHNPDSTLNATVTGITDTMTGPVSATPDCGVTFPYVLGPGATLVCSYSSALPDATSRVNTADVTTTGDVAGNSANANVVFSSTPTTEVDECTNVSDTVAGTLGTVCASDTLPKVYTYNNVISFASCGLKQFVNTASFVTNDTKAANSSSWTVNVNVPCSLGCTLTQGYWKTHNTLFPGGAPADDTWTLLQPSGPSAPFFKSSQTWYTVFWTAPAGNPYYQLADQYMAAKLNILNGASAPANVQTAITQSETLFTTYTPAQIATLKGNSSVRSQFVSLASILGSYNEGLTGPGHCSE